MRARAVKVMAAVGFSLAVLAGGCNKNKKTGMAKREQDALAADNSKFENEKDPPITAETHFAAGQLAESQDQPQRAIEQYKAALKVDPKYLSAMFRLGELYTQSRMFPDAIAAWERYITATNGAAAGYNNLAFTYEMARQPREAEAAYKRGIAKDPKDQPCRINYGLMLARQNRIAEATEQLGAVLKPAEVHYNLGSVFQQQGKNEQAIREYQMALQLDSGLTDAKTRLSELKK